jgi:hypothetical protein
MPLRRTATEVDTGRACPYCRFPLKEGVEVVQCESCDSAHHGDCWDDNGGCAIVACQGGPGAEPARARAAGAGAGGTATLAPPRAAAAPPAVSPPSSAPPPPASSGRGPWLAVAVGLLALAIAGGAAAMVLVGPASEDDSSPVESPAARSGEPDAEAPAEAPPSTRTADAPSNEEQIETTLLRYYESVAAGDFSSAWALLSPSYKNWKASNGGRAKWETQEANNHRYLEPAGLRVSITDFDRTTQVATIYVSGMTWTTGCRYTGYTWARRFGERWYYDQGYLQDPGRAAEWRSRQDEALGVLCEESAY